MKRNALKWIGRVLPYLITAPVLLFFIFPIFWVIMTGFKTAAEFMHSPPVWFPAQPHMGSFQHVIEVGGLNALKNSLIISSSTTVIALFIGSLAAYSLARYRVGGDNLPFFILSQRFMPGVVVIFPFLLMFRAVRWIDTYQALVIVNLTFTLPYTVWMMRSFFQEIPVEIEESALVDGASPFKAFQLIAVPLSTPGLVATGVFVFIFSWTEFFFALCLTQTKVVPLSVYLPNFFGKQMIMWGEVGALSTIAIVPLFVLSLLVQRYLVRGLTLGAIK
jgi:multiple sugar transport system permease protein